jgi:hypothetical protein
VASARTLFAALCAALIAIGLVACGGEETTTVTETASVEETPAAVADTETGTGEAAREEIAAPDADAKADIEKITEGLDEAQEKAGADDSDAAIEAGGGVPKLTYGQAQKGLSNARYCASDVIAGRNTSCAFALNVAYDFFSTGGARRFVSYSPVTGQYYRVRCRGARPVLCRAGNGALIAIL